MTGCLKSCEPPPPVAARNRRGVLIHTSKSGAKRHRWLISCSSLKQGYNHLKFELGIEELGTTRHEVTENPSFKELVEPVRVELVIVRTGRRLLVNGLVKFQAKLLCAVCGEEFERSFSEELPAEFISDEDAVPVKGRELESEELDRVLVQGDLLNLVPQVRDGIHLAIPIAPRCRSDCKGVCPQCGTNLNKKQCNCPKQKASPFSVLARTKQTRQE